MPVVSHRRNKKSTGIETLEVTPAEMRKLHSGRSVTISRSLVEGVKTGSEIIAKKAGYSRKVASCILTVEKHGARILHKKTEPEK